MILFNDCGCRVTSSNIVGRCLVAWLLLLVGSCSSITPKWEPLTPAQQQLRKQIQAFNRTVLEGALIGATTGAVVGATLSEDRVKGSILGGTAGAFVGNFAGSYVAEKQKRYEDREAMLESMIADVRRKNEEAADLIETMRVLLEENQALLAELRSQMRSGQATSGRYNLAIRRVRDDRADMETALESAEQQYRGFVEASEIARREPDIPNTAALDREIDTLRIRIAIMGEIVGALNTEDLG